MKLFFFILFFPLFTTAQQLNGSNKVPPVSTLTPLMAAWFDGTTSGSQLTDKSGNGRHGIITENIVTDSSGEYGSALVAWNGATGVVNSTDFAHTGTKSFKFSMTAVPSLRGMRYQYFRTVTGDTVKWSFWVYKTAGTSFTYQVVRGDGTATPVSTSVTPTVNTWTQYSGSFVEAAGGGLAEIRIFISTGDLTLYMDDLSIRINSLTTLGMIMANDATLKNIDSIGQNYLFYTSGGIPRTIRTDVTNPAIYNRQVYDGGVKKIIFLSALPNPRTHYILSTKFVDHNNMFNTIENVVTVGSGKTYATIQAAINAVTGQTSTNRYRIDVFDDLVCDSFTKYTVAASGFKDYIQVNKTDIFISGTASNRKITCTLPDSCSDASSEACTPLDIFYRGGMRNITIEKTNGRYAAHVDATSLNNQVFKFYNCTFKNFGYDGMRTYRTANSLPAPNLAGGVHAVGAGFNTNMWIMNYGCTFYGVEPVFIHDFSANTTNLSTYILTNCTLTAAPIYHITINPSSTLQSCIKIDNIAQTGSCKMWMLGCKLNTSGKYEWYWSNSSTSGYIINKVVVSTYRSNHSWVNTPRTVYVTTDGSLRITSATSGAVNITGGTAQSLIMPTPDQVSNHATGQLEVGEHAFNTNLSLGKRLGDCSVVNKTLTMTIDGVSKTVTFNQNHTNQSNATVLSFINTALAGAGTASLYQRASTYTPTKYF